MKLIDTLLLVLLAAIWGSSFIFMRATAADFGPVPLIAVRVGVAAICLSVFLLVRGRIQEFIKNWRILLIVGLLNSAFPFSLLAYASLTLSAGMVSILNAMTPMFTALVAHLWLRDKMTNLQFMGMIISILGVTILVWDKVDVQIDTWWPLLAGITSSIFYGFAANTTKKYLHNVSAMTSTAGSLLFSAIFLVLVSLFFLPDFEEISVLSWSYAIILAVLCTAFAYVIFFRLIHSIGPSRAVTVTFLVPIFSFLWAYLLLDEMVTLRMWVATGIILLGTAFVTGIIKSRTSSAL